MTDPDLSWDAGRRSAPARPAITRSVTVEPPLPRPRRVVVAGVLAIMAALCFAALTAWAGWRLDDIRASLTSALPDDLAEDHSAADIRRAVRVLIWTAGGLGVLLTLVQLLAVRSVAVGRKPGGRVLFAIAVVLFIPVTALCAVIREGGPADAALSVIAVVVLLAAVVLLRGRSVSAWLRQKERHDPIPLVPAEDVSEAPPPEASR